MDAMNITLVLTAVTSAIHKRPVTEMENALRLETATALRATTQLWAPACVVRTVAQIHRVRGTERAFRMASAFALRASMDRIANQCGK